MLMVHSDTMQYIKYTILREESDSKKTITKLERVSYNTIKIIIISLLLTPA